MVRYDEHAHTRREFRTETAVQQPEHFTRFRSTAIFSGAALFPDTRATVHASVYLALVAVVVAGGSLYRTDDRLVP